MNCSTDSWSSGSSRFDDMILSISTEIQRFPLVDIEEAKDFIYRNEVNDDEIGNIIVSDYYQLLLTIIDSGFDNKLNQNHVYLAVKNKAPYCLRILTHILKISFNWEVCLQRYDDLKNFLSCKHDINFLYIHCILLCLAKQKNQKVFNKLKESCIR